MPSYNSNQYVNVIAIESPPAGGDVVVEGVRLYITGVFRWEFVVALYEKQPQGSTFLGFLDGNGALTSDRYDSSGTLVLPWLFPFAGRALTLWCGKSHAKTRFNLWKRGGAKASLSSGKSVQ